MFDQYATKIKKMNSFAKEDILNKDFLLGRKDNISIYYAPHNEVINPNAKVFIVGITPGFTQTSIAYQTAHDGLVNNVEHNQIKWECKRNSRFVGSMRKNLIDMLNELNIQKYLNISSCEELFTDKDELLHTTSLIPYPTFIKGKNYTGHSPKIIDSDFLYSYVEKYFYQEVNNLPNSLIIPLGKSVEEVLDKMIENGIIKREQCLMGFPHPSGANGHRYQQFTENKEQLSKKIAEFFNK